MRFAKYVMKEEKLYICRTLCQGHLSGTEFKYIKAAAFLPASTARLHKAQEATELDPSFHILKEVILHRWPTERAQVLEG